METELLIRVIGSFIVVVALILGAGLILRSSSWRRVMGGVMNSPSDDARLTIQEVRVIDTKRRLILVRRDTTEHLIMLGHEGDIIIEHDIPIPQASNAP